MPSRSELRRFIPLILTISTGWLRSLQSTSPRPTQPVFATDSRGLAPNVANATTGGIPVSTKRKSIYCVPGWRIGGRSAAAFFGSGCDCDNVGLRNGDPGTTEYCLLSGGAHRLPTASQLVSTWLGVNGALSLRHLCLWTFILSSNLLLLSGGLLVPASVNSCCTPGPSQAISASWLVVVKMRSRFRR